MGYTTEFSGQVKVDPPLSPEEVTYLKKFNRTRRMNRKNGPYYVDSTGDFGQAHEADVIDYNRPPQGQPGLWCQWTPTENGQFIEWDGGEKFYNAAEWMTYIIDHFIKPKAKSKLPFLKGHTCNGEIEAQGEDANDRWKLVVTDNKVSVKRGTTVYA
jgi:hypothetical protein